MIKQSSNTRPNNIVKVSPTKWHINYNIEKVTREDETFFEFDYVTVTKLNRGVIVNAIVRKKYSESEEFGILRKQLNDIRTDEYNEYNSFVENAKTIVGGIL